MNIKPRDYALRKEQFHDAFLKSPRPHILMITNHGIHRWQILPGLPDTGGQNVFVNKMTEAMKHLGFKVTIINRGGYPNPRTGEMRQDLNYWDENQRILYIEDSTKKFIRKEDMHEHIPELLDFCDSFLKAEGQKIDLILSHYWDSVQLGVLLNDRLPQKVKHFGFPHTLGTSKKRNMPRTTWAGLRIDERIEQEKIYFPLLDGLGSTSKAISDCLKEDYGINGKTYFMPPCIDTRRFHPIDVSPKDKIWKFLSDHSSLSPEEIQQRKIVTEISRTALTKRKNVLLRAFAKICERVPEALLVLTIDDSHKHVAAGLRDLIHQLNLKDRVIVLGPVYQNLPKIFAVSDIYCTPSASEGFGMSIQEASAMRLPSVSSDAVPFAVEYLLGDQVEEISVEGTTNKIRKGAASIVVHMDDVDGFAAALEIMFKENVQRKQMAQNAYDITIPYFTWNKMTEKFLREIGMEIPTTLI